VPDGPHVLDIAGSPDKLISRQTTPQVDAVRDELDTRVRNEHGRLATRIPTARSSDLTIGPPVVPNRGAAVAGPAPVRRPSRGVLDTSGATPLVRLARYLDVPGITLHLKLEAAAVDSPSGRDPVSPGSPADSNGSVSVRRRRASCA